MPVTYVTLAGASFPDRGADGPGRDANMTNMKPIIALVALASIAACNRQSSETTASVEAPAAPAPAAEAPAAASSGGERFYGRERFTIVYAHTGQQTGMSIEHVRDWGRRRAEITDTTLSVLGVTQRTNTRAVFEGPQVATIDLGAQAVTTMTNPLYDQIVAAMRGRDGVEAGREIMTRMGGRATGERGSFAGQDCEYWEVAQLGSRSCVAPWGATLHLRSSFGGIVIERTATEVRMGDGGPDEAFEYDASRATQAPNLQDIMGKIKGQ